MKRLAFITLLLLAIPAGADSDRLATRCRAEQWTIGLTSTTIIWPGPARNAPAGAITVEEECSSAIVRNLDTTDTVWLDIDNETPFDAAQASDATDQWPIGPGEIWEFEGVAFKHVRAIADGDGADLYIGLTCYRN